MKLVLGNSAILAYRRLPYRIWYAIAEFVDNSTDAYLRGNNKILIDEQFKKTGEVFSVEVDFDRENKTLRIFDNSMGMNEAELENALIIGEKPSVSAGRSEFGMGMKTAAIWFADFIEIKTKKLGEDKELRVNIDIQKFVRGDNNIKLQSTPKSRDEHYTFIELSGLHRIIRGPSLDKTRKFLGSIYRKDIRDKLMKLTVVAQEVTAPTSKNDDAFMKRDDGTKVLVEINNLQINDKIVSGWVGVLSPGFTGRSYAGFALIRHGRAVRGWLDSWKPEEIFGDSRNDKINQRVTGELIMDDFTSSHTKDSIDWEQDDEQKLGEALLDICKQYGILLFAKKQTRGAGNEDTEREKLEAQHMFQAQILNKKVGDTIRMLDVPSPELAKFSTAVLIEAADQTTPIGIWPMDSDVNGKVAKLYEIELSPNDPYYEFQVLSNQDLKVILNSAHPANSLHDDSAEARLNHYHHVALDAIAEWKCTQMNSPLEPSSVRLMKDRLFRVIGEISADIE
jgi:hypothetical protein